MYLNVDGLQLLVFRMLDGRQLKSFGPFTDRLFSLMVWMAQDDFLASFGTLHIRPERGWSYVTMPKFGTWPSNIFSLKIEDFNPFPVRELADAWDVR